ncbi:MAG: hypothetical protein COB02_17160 [Candidatus Cloacimonadota bacterium]|nr:MAG: hypothetical protein COB02_17160 [Candidatus Cloacimonadota bacterium]
MTFFKFSIKEYPNLFNTITWKRKKKIDYFYEPDNILTFQSKATFALGSGLGYLGRVSIDNFGNLLIYERMEDSTFLHLFKKLNCITSK